MSPEQQLWQAVVVKALTDATAPNASSRDDRCAKSEAHEWIKFGGRDFRKACALAGFDHDFIREKYLAGKIDGELLRSAEKKGRAE